MVKTLTPPDPATGTMQSTNRTRDMNEAEDMRWWVSRVEIACLGGAHQYAWSALHHVKRADLHGPPPYEAEGQ